MKLTTSANARNDRESTSQTTPCSPETVTCNGFASTELFRPEGEAEFSNAFGKSVQLLKKENCIPKDLKTLRQLFTKWNHPVDKRMEFEILRGTQISSLVNLKHRTDFNRDLLNFILRVTSIAYQSLIAKPGHFVEDARATMVLSKMHRILGGTEYEDVLIEVLSSRAKRSLASWFVQFWQADTLPQFRKLIRMTLKALKANRHHYRKVYSQDTVQFNILIFGQRVEPKFAERDNFDADAISSLAQTAALYRERIAG